MKSIALASQSPRRRQLLEQLGASMGFEVVVLAPDADEDAEALEQVLPGERPQDYVQRVTLLKLEAGIARLRKRYAGNQQAWPILASDTTVALSDEILGKPEDAKDARRMLKSLSGRSHWVHTAVAIAFGPGEQQVVKALSSSKVEFAELSEAWIDWVIQTGEPMDKAGAYAIQGHAGSMIKRIEGSPTGIMGLPLHETRQLLAQVIGEKSGLETR
ncbi:MAG: Maf family protein [Burkholderiaceae bacterium]